MPSCNVKIGTSLTVVVDGKSVTVTCDYKCDTCDGDVSNCTSCAGSNRNEDPPNCTCKSGYTDKNGLSTNCIELYCPSHCEACDEATYTCT